MRISQIEIFLSSADGTNRMTARDARYKPYARETALCVDVAYEGLEAELRLEMTRAGGETKVVLRRLLERLIERREALERFTIRTGKAA